MIMRCELCQRELDFDFPNQPPLSFRWQLYAHGLHLMLVHNFPEQFQIKADGEGRWLVNGKVVLVDADKFPTRNGKSFGIKRLMVMLKIFGIIHRLCLFLRRRR